MHSFDPIQAQKMTEERFSKRRIRKLLEEEILTDHELYDLLEEAAISLEEYRDGEYYLQKNERLSHLRTMDMFTVAKDILITLHQLEGRTEKITAVVGRFTESLRFSDQIDGVKTAAEMLAVLSKGDNSLLTIGRNEFNELTVTPNFVPEQETIEELRQTKYLPPMVCEPLHMDTNWSGGLLTQQESVILKAGNHHDKNVCLDHLNRMNRIPLCLNVQFLSTVSEAPKHVIVTPEQQEQWDKFMRDSYRVYVDLVKQGNRFWPRHKYCKRGRTYVQGYHVSYQGSEFKKAIVDLADAETIDVPEEYRL